MPNTSLVSSSFEEVQRNLIDLATTHFGTTDINFYKTGLMAWIINCNADIVSDLALYNTLSFGERFLNTSKFLSSVIEIGDTYGYDFSNAVPADLVVSVAFKIDPEIEAYFDEQNKILKASGKSNVSPKPIVLDSRECKFFSNDIDYMLPGTINILKRPDYNWQVVIENNDNFDSKFRPILKSFIKEVEIGTGVYAKFLMFNIDTKQFKITTDYITIGSRIDLAFYEFDLTFVDYFHKIELYYYETDPITQVKYKKFLTKSVNLIQNSPTDDAFKVNILSENKIRIVLGNGVNGKYYQTGKEIYYDLYTTKGSAGNATKPELKIALPMEMNQYTFYPVALSDAINGKDSPTILEHKENIRKQIQTPKSLITEFDYQNKISSIFGIKENELFTMLRRNDPIERRIDLFLLFNNNSEMVKTNTLNVSLDVTEIATENTRTIRPFFLVESGKEISDTNDIIQVNKFVPINTKKVANKFYYSNFYAIKIHTTPTYAIDFFDLSTNYELVFKEKYDNKNFAEEIIVNSIKVTRDIFAFETSYTFTLELSASTTDFLKNNNLIVRAFFHNNSKKNFYLDFTKLIDPLKPEQQNIYVAKLESKDEISDDNYLFVKNVFLKKDETILDYEEWYLDTTGIELTDNFAMTLSVMYNYDVPDLINEPLFIKQRDINHKVLLKTITIENINCYFNLKSVYRSDLEKQESFSSERLMVNVLHLPLFSNDFINLSANKQFLLTFNENLKMFNDMYLSYNEIPSNLAIKYFNSFGFIDSYKNLDKTQMTLQIEVSFKNNIYIGDVALNSIKDNIISYLTKVNYRPMTDDKNIYISEIISIIMNNADIIQARILNYSDNIFFIGNTDLKRLTKEDLKYFTPSVINVVRDDITFINKVL